MGSIGNIIHYLRIYRSYIGRRIYLLFALTIATAFTQGFGITLLLPLLSSSQQSGGTGESGRMEQFLETLLQWMGIADSTVGILVFIAAVFIGKGVLQFASVGYRGYLQSELLRRLKVGLFDSYSEMDYRHYIKHNAGHFINVINQQVDRFFMSFNDFVGFSTHVIMTISYFGFAFSIAWRFALMAVAAGGVLLFLFKYLNAYVQRLSRKRSSEMSHLNKLLVQALQAYKYVASTHQSSHLRSGIVESVRRLTSYIFRQRTAGALTVALREPASVLLVIGLIIVQVLIFDASIAPIFVALLLFHRGMQSVMSMQGSWQTTMDKVGAVEMVVDEDEMLHAHREQNGTHDIDALSEGIKFDGVHFAYDDDEGDVLKDVNVQVPVNTSVAFVGGSGAGKSTLVDMLTLLLRPRSGTVYVDGVAGERIKLGSWRSQIGYVAQETVVFDDTIANNICLWRGDPETNPACHERIQDAARRAYADEFIQDLPNGYQTVVGDRGIRLSGGQRQRLFVARELYKNPNLLILDEATSALDTESERYIQESIDALKGETTVVIIAHRLSTIKNVDYVYVLEDGRVVEEGTYEKLRMSDQSRFSEMVEMQQL